MRLIAVAALALSLAAFGVAEPVANPNPLAQQLTNNAPFSGAVYIVNPNGEQVVAQDTNWCPASASVSCSSVNQPSWCCPSNYVCAVPGNSNGLIGCCPSGSACAGAVNVAQVTTVTVYTQQATAVVYAEPPRTTVYNNPNPVQGGFCATLTMDGPGLPRTQDGDCGTILIVAEAPSLKIVGTGMVSVLIILHFALGRMFHRA